MEYFALSDIGKNRQNNEDCYLADEQNNLFIVADGMGGHNAGEVASKTAIDNFVLHFKKKFNKKNFNLSVSSIVSDKKKKKIEDNIPRILIDSAGYANEVVYKLGSKRNDLNGMGTTLTGVFIFNSNAFVIHVGDSRLYLFRKNSLSLLTEDHTIVFALYKKGAISYEDMFSHPQRNYLTGVLGENELSSLDCFKFKLQENDIIFICSDGLNSMIKDTAIKDTLNKLQGKSAEIIAKKFIKQANKNGGADNITVIIIKI
ncbi:MAG: Stp1/IreP family PP2C-type Ser/Thr phosphatase [Candidatus Humimicrobiaceae bacterium]